MQNLELKIIYEDNNLLVVDKPAGIIVFQETRNKKQETNKKTLINLILEQRPEIKNVGKAPRYGIVHRLDKDTSGILLTAKNNKSLIFFQKQFSALSGSASGGKNKKPEKLEKKLKKRYIALVVGKVKNDFGKIETLIGRGINDRRKQKIYLPHEPNIQGKREAVTEYKVMEKFRDYTLLEISPKTGRKHQIRCHFSYLGHPIAGDKVYSFKNQPCPKGLNRQFLHASYLKIELLDGRKKEFKSKLPEDLEICLQKLKPSTKPN